ncbi:ABC-2 family transporter protein [Paenibacillus polysaccharolyticus]|uniref:ABC transporter permease n=1 Tax=Paenibacillus polysaccharolyticus TaxID=582692 RepID=UPI00203E3831|nr:ABC-2 family transporter protein [Paenibacillus polysaccharolyticus]MCM3132890.1 ABC-2 family transporter protein [Paenibacillus polysaccharolyticus]
MRHFQKYTHLISIGIQEALEYKAAFFIFVVSSFFPIIIKYYLWTVIYDNSPSSVVFGYTSIEMINYTIISSLISKITVTGFKWDVNDDIKNGGLNKYLIKPMPYSVYRLCNYIGNKAIQFIIVIIIPFVVIIAFQIFDFQIKYENIPLFLIALLMALILNFFMFYSISLCAFWLHEALGVFLLADVIINFLSGGLFPLDVFGDRVLSILKLLPFQYTIYFPSNVLSGKVEWEEFVMGITYQVIWTGVFIVISKWVWRSGIKAFNANGG